MMSVVGFSDNYNSLGYAFHNSYEDTGETLQSMNINKDLYIVKKVKFCGIEHEEIDHMTLQELRKKILNCFHIVKHKETGKLYVTLD